MAGDTRRLLVAWAVLAALTAVTAVAARAIDHAPLHVASIVVLGLSSAGKARVILDHYLDLRLAPGWRSTFTALLVGLVVLVYALCLIGG